MSKSMSAFVKNLIYRLRTSLLALTLPTKCALLAVTLLALHSLLLLTASARGNEQLMEQQQDLLARQWVEQIAYQTQQGLMQTDKLALLSVLRLHLQNPLLHYARIVDSEQRIIVEAGEYRPELQMFSSDIHLGKDIAGNVAIGFDGSISRGDRATLNAQLFILAAVLTSLAAALLFMGGSKLDRLFQRARDELLRPSEKPEFFGYSGNDSMGELLRTVHQGEAELLQLTSQTCDWIVLHVHWQHFPRLNQQWGKAELDKRLHRSYQAALSLSRLYHGQLDVLRNDGVSLRFNALQGADEPLLRALCCGWLLQELDSDLGASARIGLVRAKGSRFALAASQAALVDSLAQLPASAGMQTRLSGEMKELLNQWVDWSDDTLTLKVRYQSLLEKQLTRLRRQLEADAGELTNAV